MIKELREQKGWTQSELARRAGILQGVLSCIESGKTKNPRIDTLGPLAKALGCSIEELYPTEDEERSNT